MYRFISSLHSLLSNWAVLWAVQHYLLDNHPPIMSNWSFGLSDEYGWGPLVHTIFTRNILVLWSVGVPAEWSAIPSKYKFCFFSQSSKCQSMVVESLNVWSNWPEDKNCFQRTIHSHNDVSKVSLLRNLFFWSHGVWFYMLIWVLMMFIKIMGIYKCSLPWCLFWSIVRDLFLDR